MRNRPEGQVSEGPDAADMHELFATWRQQAGQAMAETAMLIEALGSVQDVEAGGWFRHQPTTLEDMMMRMLPVSRGGAARHPEAVRQYETAIDRMYETHGVAFFSDLHDRARALAAQGELGQLAGRLADEAIEATRRGGAGTGRG